MLSAAAVLRYTDSFTPSPGSRPAFKSKNVGIVASGSSKTVTASVVAVVHDTPATVAPSSASVAVTITADPLSSTPSTKSKSNAAALAAFATVMAPLTTQPEEELLEDVSIGYGIVACAVSVALGFSIGYVVP